MWQYPAFRYVLRQALSSHCVLVYESDYYISFARLHDVLDARMADIESYEATVSVDAPQGEPFTVVTLCADGGSLHPLYALGMPTISTRGYLTQVGSSAAVHIGRRQGFVAGVEGRLVATDLT